MESPPLPQKQPLGLERAGANKAPQVIWNPPKCCRHGVQEKFQNLIYVYSRTYQVKPQITGTLKYPQH